MKAEELAEELRMARYRARLPQRRVAMEIGIDDRLLRAWENGERTPRLGHLIAWATALGKRIVIE